MAQQEKKQSNKPESDKSFLLSMLKNNSEPLQRHQNELGKLVFQAILFLLLLILVIVLITQEDAPFLEIIVATGSIVRLTIGLYRWSTEKLVENNRLIAELIKSEQAQNQQAESQEEGT
jgi:hypothetical protein